MRFLHRGVTLDKNSSNVALKDISIREISLNYDRKPWSFQTDGLVWGTPIGEKGVTYVGSAQNFSP